MAAHRHYQRPDGSMMEGGLAAAHALARKRFPNGDWNPDYPPPNPWMKDPIVPKGRRGVMLSHAEPESDAGGCVVLTTTTAYNTGDTTTRTW